MATIDGTSGNDTLTGTSSNDTLNGLGGDDLLIGSGGNDSLIGGDGNDTLNGGTGDDSISGGNNNDTLNGGDGKDSLDGGPGDDFLIAGGTGNNQIDDLFGNDTVSYEAENSAISFVGNRTVIRAGGVDTVSPAVEQINGTFFADGLGGSSVNDHNLGFSGNDTLNGFGGDDVLEGGRGDDAIFGDAGNDTLIGGLGNDILVPAGGSNLIDASQGQDTITFGFDATAINFRPDNTVGHDGGANDTIVGAAVINGTPFADTFNGGAADDNFNGAGGDDALNGGGGSDTLNGGAGNDTLNAGTGDRALLMGGLGSDTLIGSQTLSAVASWADLPVPVMFDATLGLAFDTQGGLDSVVGCTSFVGSPHNDTLNAGVALDGMVDFYGGGGDDVFTNGGFDIEPTGLVRVRYDFEPAGGTIDLQAQTATFPGHLDILVQMHAVVGTPFDDSILGTFEDDVIDGGAGDDSIDGGIGGNDSINAGAGNDTVVVAGMNINSTVDGGSGSDTFDARQVGVLGPLSIQALAEVNTWQATSVSVLVETHAGATVAVGKSEGTLRLLLDGLEQHFDAAPYGLDLVLVAAGNLTGTLGMGDDTVIAAAGAYSLDGGAGLNVIDYAGVAAGVMVAVDGGQATAQNGADTETLEHFLVFHGSPFADSFTSQPLDAVAPLGAGDILAVLEGGGLADVATVVGAGGADSYRGRLAVDYRSTGGAVTIAAGAQAGTRQATVPGGGTDTLQDVAAVLLPAAANTADFGSDSNLLVEVSGGHSQIVASSGSVLSYLNLATALSIDLAQGRATHGSDTDSLTGIANVIGGSGDDTITGNGQDNILAPAGGSNVVDGGDGDDTLVLGTPLSGVAGQAYFAEGQRLLLLTLDDGPAAQSASHVESASFAGEMVAIADLARALPVFDGATAIDAAHRILFAGTQNDDIAGDGVANLILDRGGANRVDGVGGNDLIRMTGADSAAAPPPPGPAADLPPDLASDPPGAGDDVLAGGTGDDTVLAGPGADLVDGGTGNDLLFGDDGADSIGGGDGNDVLLGGAGNDLLAGEAGNDTLYGEGGQDILIGGAGDDRLQVDADDQAAIGAGGFDVLVVGAGLTLIDLSAAEDQNQSGIGPAVSGIEGVDASAAAAPVSLQGGSGGGGGNLLIGGIFDDTLVGGAGNDTLIGGGGADVLDAGAGNDSIVLGLGADTVTGGAGSDRFVYPDGEAAAGIVQVLDFTPGTDRVELPASLAATANAALALLTMTGDGALLLADTGAGIFFVGIAAANLSAGDFVIGAGL